jgi:hypothetical protein
MEESPLETIPALGPQKRLVNKRFVYLILTILILLVAFFSYRIFGAKEKGAISQKPAIVTPSPTDTPFLTPTSSPSVTTAPTITPIPSSVDKTTGLDRGKLSVVVQNGSGEEGVAGKAESILKTLGYDVISAGNADNFNYTNVVIQVKAARSNYLGLLKTDLGLSYTIGTNSADLPDSFSSNALVIIGK